MIQLHRLEGFFWVAKTGGYARAARAFPYPITQPAVHQQVKKLESELELQLFERVAKDRMQLTAAGQRLFDFCAPFFQGLPAVVRSLQSGEYEGTLTIHAAGTMLRHLLPSWLKRLQRKHPGIQVELAERLTSDLTGLRNGDADLVVDYLHEVPDDLCVMQVGLLRAFVVLPSTHPAAKKKRVQLSDFQDETFVSYTPGTLPHGLQMQALADHSVNVKSSISIGTADAILGFVESGGNHLTLPLPLPTTDEAAQVVADNLRRISSLVPHVAFENWAGFFAADPAEHDPGFFHAICETSGASMLLDLHNVQTHCHNTGADPDAYVDALDLSRVVEIHIAGGSWSEPKWVPSGRVFRLDGHDGPVTDWEWQTLARILPRCTNLQGVTLERLPHTLEAQQVPGFVAEFERLRALVDAAVSEDHGSAGQAAVLSEATDLEAWEVRILEALDALEPDVGLDTDALRITGRIVQKLRFERLCTDPELARWFATDPRGFVQAFKAYHRAVPPRFVWATDEVAAFRQTLSG